MKNDMEAKELEIIAGPCSAESREQVLATARQLRALGIGTFRAGLWKPRSRPGAFEGCGAQALPWLQEVQGLGMRVMTEVALPEHVEAALAAGVDGLWIGARTVVNPFLMDRLAEVLAGADVFIGVSAPGAVTTEMVQTMNRDAILFACANPTPEIFPDEAKAGGAKVVATGRSDFPNQINNVLAFPGIFRGAFDVRAKDINDQMKIAAAYALAALISPGELSADYIIPKAFDPRVGKAVAAAVAQAARDSGVARI